MEGNVVSFIRSQLCAVDICLDSCSKLEYRVSITAHITLTSDNTESSKRLTDIYRTNRRLFLDNTPINAVFGTINNVGKLALQAKFPSFC